MDVQQFATGWYRKRDRAGYWSDWHYLNLGCEHAICGLAQLIPPSIQFRFTRPIFWGRVCPLCKLRAPKKKKVIQ